MTSSPKTIMAERLHALALLRYDDSYGWSVIVECYEVSDLEEIAQEHDTWESFLSFMEGLVSVWTDQYQGALADGGLI